MGDLHPEHGRQSLVMVLDEVHDLQGGGVGVVPVPDQVFEGRDGDQASVASIQRLTIWTWERAFIWMTWEEDF